MARYALIDSEGNVVNTIVWDGDTEYTPPESLDSVEDTNEEFSIGGTIIDDVYTPPVVPEEE